MWQAWIEFDKCLELSLLFCPSDFVTFFGISIWSTAKAAHCVCSVSESAPCCNSNAWLMVILFLPIHQGNELLRPHTHYTPTVNVAHCWVNLDSEACTSETSLLTENGANKFLSAMLDHSTIKNGAVQAIVVCNAIAKMLSNGCSKEILFVVIVHLPIKFKVPCHGQVGVMVTFSSPEWRIWDTKVLEMEIANSPKMVKQMSLVMLFVCWSQNKHIAKNWLFCQATIQWNHFKTWSQWWCFHLWQMRHGSSGGSKFWPLCGGLVTPRLTLTAWRDFEILTVAPARLVIVDGKMPKKCCRLRFDLPFIATWTVRNEQNLLGCKSFNKDLFLLVVVIRLPWLSFIAWNNKKVNHACRGRCCECGKYF